MDNKIIIYTDGGAKRNPGPASIGAVIHLSEKQKKEYSERIGETTNNIAEYSAVIFALKKLKQLVGKDDAKKKYVEVRSDSQLLVSQINGEYKIKNEGMKEKFIELWNIKQDFKNVEFKHIPREENTAADRLVNEAML
ncbi:MAG: ribonuclease HI family protein [Candidatus Paceibacterota bacterium]